MAGEARFAALVESMLAHAGTTYGADGSGPQRAFGSTSLKTNDKIFAMLVNGRLVVKPGGGSMSSLRPASESGSTPATAA